jgi:hypothetical protein
VHGRPPGPATVVGVSGLVVVPTSPELDAANDPGASVVAALETAKGWLEQARVIDLPNVVEAKARAEAVRCYVAQKHLGKEAELAASEIVRRAERRIGELVREGQAAGEIRKQGEHKVIANQHGAVDSSGTNSSPKQPAGEMFASTRDRADIYAMTDDVSPDEFEEALGEAKDEENLSRRNVVRKVREVKDRGSAPRSKGSKAERVEQIRELARMGNTSDQIASQVGIGLDHVRRLAAEEGIELQADRAIGRARRIDPNRVLRETVTTLEGVVSTLHLIDLDRVERDSVDESVASLRSSLRQLQRFTKELAQ